MQKKQFPNFLLVTREMAVLTFEWNLMEKKTLGPFRVKG